MIITHHRVLQQPPLKKDTRFPTVYLAAWAEHPPETSVIFNCTVHKYSCAGPSGEPEDLDLDGANRGPDHARPPLYSTLSGSTVQVSTGGVLSYRVVCVLEIQE